MKRHGLAAWLLIGLGACSGDDRTATPAPSDGGVDDAPTGGDDGPWGAVPITSQMAIRGLGGPVDVVRDRYGVIHIHATSLEDAARVQGYQLGRDRTAQVELIRRSARGRLAELFGGLSPAVIDQDITMRTLGLARPAADMLATMPAVVRAAIEAYADGLSQFNERVRSGEEPIPVDLTGFFGLSRDAFQPWTAEDVVAVARFQAMGLSYFAPDDLNRSLFLQSLQGAMNPDAQDPRLAKRAGVAADMMNFAPLARATILPVPPSANARATNAARPSLLLPTLQNTTPFLTALEQTRELIGGHIVGVTGSNNWAVGPSRSASGNAMLASDPHLRLGAPTMFWTVHLDVDAPDPAERVDVAGVAFPGIPFVIVGFNQDVAWGPTTSIYDASDVYDETLSQDGSGVVFRGNVVPFEKIHETIAIQNGAPLEYDVLVVPHHGPVIPTITPDHKVAPPSGKALSVKWTGLQATRDFEAIFGLLRAKNVDDAQAALANMGTGGQDWVAADKSGNILFSSHTLVPKREKGAFAWDPATFTGTLPCLVQPGDGSAEWTGEYLSDAEIPQTKNPKKGYIVTANNDPLGGSLDGNPANDSTFLGCSFDSGIRAARISERIEGADHPLDLDDMARIQSDARSAMGATLVPGVLAAISRGLAEKTTPGSQPDLSKLVAGDRWKKANVKELASLLERWRDEADFEAAAGINLDDNSLDVDAKEAMASKATALFNVWVSQMLLLTFDDELAAAGIDLSTMGNNPALDRRISLMHLLSADKTKLATFDAATGDSSLFDDLRTPELESRDDRILTALLDAVDFLDTRFGGSDWRWGRLHRIRFAAPNPTWSNLSIPSPTDPVFPDGFPRHGDGFNVDVSSWVAPAALDAKADYSVVGGASQRLVVEMTPDGPRARNALPGGNVWDPKDKHFRDDAEFWRKNQNHPVAFTTTEVVEAAESRVRYR